MDLTDVQMTALTTLASLPNVWPLRDTAEARIAAGVLDELAAMGLVSLWKRHDGEAVVLTPSAADALGLVAEEKWEYRTDEVTHPTRRDHTLRCRVATEIPHWTIGERDEAGVSPRKRRVKVGETAVLREKPVVPPGYAIEAPPAFLLVKPPPKKGTTEYRTEDGETTTDPAKALRAFAGPDGKGGIPIVVDPRLKRQRPVEAARRALAGRRKRA